MNRGAVAHMPDSRYCFCIEPGRFVIRLQTGRDDLDEVLIHTRDKYLPIKLFDTREVRPMTRVAQDHSHDYYEVRLDLDLVCLRYFFELVDRAGQRRYFSYGRFAAEPFDDNDRMFDCPQVLREQERFVVPKWAENKVIYQIFPSRFASSQKVSERVWYQAPIDGRAELKGDLKGIESRLEYIRDLGVDIVYMTPIFKSKSFHKYDTIDYYTIDPDFGTEDDLIRLVDKAHAMGMRVVLDGVFNHTAPEFFAFRDVMQNWETTPYRNWYYLTEKPVVPRRLVKPSYKCFSYFGGMPKLNLANQETADYFINVALYWLRTAHIDGWRLDVADEVSHIFWRRFREEVKREFPDTLIIGEVWHYAGDFLQGDTWDSVMNYPFLNAVVDFAAEQTITATEFLNELGYLRGNLNTAAIPVLWNLLGSHDTPRILHRCGENKEKMKLAAAMQLLLPGMPMIYYGDEVGLTGGRDPDCRRGMLWDETRQDRELLSYYRRLIALRKAYPCLLKPDADESCADDENGMIILRRGEVTLLFHGREGTVALPRYEGCREMITDTPFSGVLKGCQAAVLLTK